VRRVVLVERPTEYADLLARHGTREQVRFFLAGRGIEPDAVEARHAAFVAHRRAVLGAIPGDWRQAVAARADLDRFLFEPDDILVVLGQDGLVANVAKYLDGQPVIGLDPDPGRNAGVLVRHDPAAAADLLADVARGRAAVETRTMARATLDDGQSVLALNEIFVGHPTHQSARYALSAAGMTERQSSSGLIVTTGTGATGWAASIARERASRLDLPAPTERRLAFFVREAWPSGATGTALTEGTIIEPDALAATGEMGDGGVLFGDGIEADHLRLEWGQTVRVDIADKALALVV
jgi:hypothetical protein